MTVVMSKYVDLVIDKLERNATARMAVSHALVGAAVTAWSLKILYPLLIDTKSNNKSNKNLHETKEKSDNFSSKPHTDQDHNVCDGSVKITQHNNNNNLSKYDQAKDDDDGNETETETKKTNFPNDEQKWAEAEKLLLEQQLKQHRHHQRHEPGLNREFIQQLLKLTSIMIPKPFCYETGLLCVHTLCLISRTFLSIYVASLEGTIVKHIVRKDVQRFIFTLAKWFGIAIPATFINSAIRFLDSKLSLAFRTRLVRHSYGLYFQNQNYYRLSNLDDRIENAEYRLTEDITVFASSIAHLYSSITKPCFDLMLIGLTLMGSTMRLQGLKRNILFGPVLSVMVIVLTGHIMRIVSPKFAQLVSEEANRYAYLKHIHSRIITNAEEIAFYGGHKVELQQLHQAYNRLVNQMNYIYAQKLWFVMLEQFFMKYVWSGIGMVMVSLPVLTGISPTSASGNKNAGGLINHQEAIMLNSSISERSQYLTTARNLLISAADAIERLMSSYKEIVTFSGYTYRVAVMLDVLTETAQGIYHKRQITDHLVQINENTNQPLITMPPKGRIIYTKQANDMSIKLHSVPVITPNNDVVVSSLDLHIEPGMHLLITGPNGCGKSSLFRIISGLWPIYDGELHLPEPVDGKPCMFYIPQRPYMSIGSLCDQIIYPDTRENMYRKGITEVHLKEILRLVALEHIAHRDSFDVIRDWKDILSGGEKQRMAIARLFYHKPRYALLDECTSAVSIDVESSIYETAKDMGITLLTITHRPTLWKFHTHILQFDGLGGWDFRTLTPNEQQQPQQPPLLQLQ